MHIIMQVIATKSIHINTGADEFIAFSPWENFFVNPFGSVLTNYVSVHVSIQVLVEAHAVQQ